MNLPGLDISCRWNHTMGDLLCVFEIHSCCSIYQYFIYFFMAEWYCMCVFEAECPACPPPPHTHTFFHVDIWRGPMSGCSDFSCTFPVKGKYWLTVHTGAKGDQTVEIPVKITLPLYPYKLGVFRHGLLSTFMSRAKAPRASRGGSTNYSIGYVVSPISSQLRLVVLLSGFFWVPEYSIIQVSGFPEWWLSFVL